MESKRVEVFIPRGADREDPSQIYKMETAADAVTL